MEQKESYREQLAPPTATPQQAQVDVEQASAQRRPKSTVAPSSPSEAAKKAALRAARLLRKQKLEEYWSAGLLGKKASEAALAEANAASVAVGLPEMNFSASKKTRKSIGTAAAAAVPASAESAASASSAPRAQARKERI